MAAYNKARIRAGGKRGEHERGVKIFAEKY